MLFRTALCLIAVSSAPLLAQDTALFRRNAAATFGFPGLVQVPSAASTPSGTADLTLDNARQSFVPGSDRRQRNAFVTIGFLPRLTLGARGTSAGNSSSVIKTGDLSASFSLRLLDERDWRPAVAVGAEDVGGAHSLFTARYLVASKTWLGRSTVSVGVGHGKVLNGVFGGVGLRVAPWMSALGEFDGHDVNGGVRLFPFPSLADRVRVQPRVDVVWRQGSGVAVSGGIRTLIGGKGEAGARETRDNETTRQETRDNEANTAAAIAAEQQLIALGFENARVASLGNDQGARIEVEYENRRYNRDELDALGIVMGVAASHAAAAQRMRVTILKVGVPVMTVESGVAAFVAFVSDSLSDAAFAEQLTVLDVADAFDGAGAPRRNSSRFKLDVFLRPRVETQELTELGELSARVTALVEGDVQLGPGLVLNARRGIPVTTTSAFWPYIEDPNADRLLLHQALRIPFTGRSPLASAITQFSAGRFGHRAVGIANETDVPLFDGRVSVGSNVAVFGTTVSALDSVMALGTLRVRQPAWDLTASLTAGRFRNGDDGIATQLARQFGATELAFFFRSTSLASVAGISVALPLAPARELRPSRVRVRAPDLYTQSMQTTVLADRNVIRRDVGRVLDTDHEIARTYRNRDRLQPVTVIAHVETLKEAWRRWVGAKR